MKYMPAEGARLTKKDAQVIGDRLEFLEKRDGFYTPESVAKDGRNRRSPLFRYFEGRDKGYAIYLLERARYLIESIRIAIPDSPEPVRASQSVRVDNGPVYVNTETVMEEDRLRLQCVDRGVRALRTWLRMYGFYKELAEASKTVEGIIHSFETKEEQRLAG